MTDTQVALLALIVSTCSFALSVWGVLRDNRRAKTLLLAEMYRGWLSVEEQTCRRLLYEAQEGGTDFAALDPTVQSQVNHAVASLNMLAFCAPA